MGGVQPVAGRLNPPCRGRTMGGLLLKLVISPKGNLELPNSLLVGWFLGSPQIMDNRKLFSR